MRNPRILALALIVILLAGCGPSGTPTPVRTIEGSGKMMTETRDVTSFTSVRIEGAGDVRVTQGDSESMSISGEDNIVPLIKTEVSDGKLTISVKSPDPEKTLRPSRWIDVNLTMKTLKAVEVIAGGSFQGTNINTDSLAVTINGGGYVALTGHAPTQVVTIAGGGEYQANDVDSSSIKVNIRDSGLVTVWARDTLDVVADGAAIIQYWGSPKTTKEGPVTAILTKLGDK